ncbi:MAG: glycosyltransferase family 2 protein, partial [Smithella sp.]|nr:glycosyltransferase family 2 protein [Smithella sp.]
MKNSISVIIPVYNGAAYLPSAIKSVLTQTSPPDEIFVVDGPSTDATPEIAKSFQGVRYLRQQGEGLAEARNLGLSQAGGNLIAFLDCDDWWEPDKLQRQLARLNDQSDSFGNLTWVKLFLHRLESLRPGFKIDAFKTGQPGFTPGALVARRSLFDHVGYFNPKYKIGCDADWFARVQDAGFHLDVIPEVLLH